MNKYLHWHEAFWGKAQKQIHEGLGTKWTISYHCGDMWCPIVLTSGIRTKISKLAKNPRNAERRWWAPVSPWMSSVRESSQDRWCYHVRRVLPTNQSRESWLVERGESCGWIIVWGEAWWSFVWGEDCWVYKQSPTLIRSGKDNGYIRMDTYLHWYEAFWGKAQKQIHEGLGPKWTISYHYGDMWCPKSLQ